MEPYELKVFNQSRIGDYLDCHRYYYLGYETLAVSPEHPGLKPRVERMPLLMGHIYHEAVAEYYRSGRDVPKAKQLVLERFQDAVKKYRVPQQELPVWEAEWLTCLIMVENYHTRYKNEALIVLAPEVVGKVRLGSSDYWLAFRTDVLHNEYNVIGLIDHKTTAVTPSGQTVANIHNAMQFTAYMYGVSKQTGLDARQMKIRWAVKKAKYAPSEMHLEETTTRTFKDFKRFEDEAVWICEEIEQHRKDGKWAHNWNNCMRYGECEFRKLCLHHEDPVVFGAYTFREPDYVDAARLGELKETIIGATGNPNS
jgi:hypothetical protein